MTATPLTGLKALDAAANSSSSSVQELWAALYSIASDLPRMHGVAVSLVPNAMDDEASHTAIAVCHELIESQVPCRRLEIELFAVCPLVMWRWPTNVESKVAELMRSYIRADYIPVEVTDSRWAHFSSTFADQRTALEVAIRQKNIPAAQVLLEAGARLTQRPRVGKSEPAHRDMVALARYLWDNESMVSQLTEAAMRGQVASVLVSPDVPSPSSIPSRRPRLML
ncbi:hypothetical protein [Methylibium petroleiphilum]|uniref:Uncharacterized protein n=1 Tax=Methylibium petroleiphilum (strain ATCC BAA-1232 / LMG 22953 / PM1) TaxID=420662 RepID=A2SPB1_METPP|nr:hypothetical protein [Methylibium petroleiphilum]ABM97400.1 hypothetical protein Mpe_B0636 [Methylibium petroleiphilum PM1]